MSQFNPATGRNFTDEEIAANQARRREIYETVGGLGGDYRGSTRGSMYSRLGVPEGTPEDSPLITAALQRLPRWRGAQAPAPAPTPAPGAIAPTTAPPLGPPQAAPTSTGMVPGSNFRQGRLERMKRRFGGVTRAPGVQTTAPPTPMGGIAQA